MDPTCCWVTLPRVFFTLELARLLIQNGHEVAFLGLLDTYPPEIKSQANPLRVK